MPVTITLIGLHQIGASLGLALGRHPDQVKRIGIDREPDISAKAKKAGACDQVAFNLTSAVEDADVVVLALPADEIRSTLEAIASNLRSGAVVLDTSTSNLAILKMAEDLFPADRHFLNLIPSLNPTYLNEQDPDLDTPHADLFENSVMAITSSSNANSEALKLASDFAMLVGAKPFFADAFEADGLLAAVQLLPQLSAVALLHATQNQPGWKEARKLTSRAYSSGTLAAASLPGKLLEEPYLQNRENSIRLLNDLLSSLQLLRDLLADQDAIGLRNVLAEAGSDRFEWLNQRQRGDWDHTPNTAIPSKGEMLGRLIGLRPKSDRKKDKK